MSQQETKNAATKTKEPNNVQKLLFALQSAQGKVVDTSIPKVDKKKVNNTKKVKGPPKVNPQPQIEQSSSKSKRRRREKKISVAARMQQQQQQNVLNDARRPRNVSVSKNQATGGRGPRIPEDVLDDLEFRFISNMPTNDKKSTVRVCFQAELAHWFYIDHIVANEERKDCQHIGFRDFSKALFYHCKELRKMSNDIDEIIATWRDYKSTVPTYGGILIDQSLENVLLVQSYYSKSNSWGFPKGKINQNEPPRECAIRETLEETGFDFGTISKKEKKVQKFINDSMVRLYIVPDVPFDFPFAPQTRKEIRKIQWFRIADLPADRSESPPPHLQGHKFFMVIPFMHDIQRFAEKELERRKATKPAQSIFSQLFPNVSNSESSKPTYKRMTSEELFSSFRKTDEARADLNITTEVEQPEPIIEKEGEEAEEIARPTLTQMSPGVRGMDILASLGLCTPLKPPENSASFPAAGKQADYETPETAQNEPPVVGFAMPQTLQKPVVTSAHPWQSNKKEEPYHGWLDSQLVNTIMHPPVETASSSENRNLSHLISKPIQPQPIMPVAATQSALESAEAPKRSSRISLSDNSAFTAITAKTSSARPTAPPQSAPTSAEQRRRCDSLNCPPSGTPTPGSAGGAGGGKTSLASRALFTSITSPVSSGLRSILGDSNLSLAASIQELSLINKDVFSPISDRHVQQQQQQPKNQLVVTGNSVPGCNAWSIPVKIDHEFAVGPVELWNSAFSIRA